MKTAFSTKSALFLSLTLLASTGLFADDVKPAEKKETVAPAATDNKDANTSDANTSDAVQSTESTDSDNEKANSTEGGFFNGTKTFFNNRYTEVINNRIMALFAVFSVLHLGRYGYNFLFEEDEIDVRRSRCRTE